MVSKGLSQIRGTVIQRSFVPHDLAAVLNIATVPLSEVYSGVTETEDIGPTLRQVTSEILGIPKETIIDDLQYRKLRKLVRDGDLFQSYPSSAMRFLWREMFDEYLLSEKSFPTQKELKIDGSLNQLSKDSLCLLASSHVGGNFPIFPFFCISQPTHRHRFSRYSKTWAEVQRLSARALTVTIRAGSPNRRSWT